MLDLVDVFVDESVVQKTMAVVKPTHRGQHCPEGFNIIVKELVKSVRLLIIWLVPGIMGEDADQHVSECCLGGGSNLRHKWQKKRVNKRTSSKI